jgi:hypothetical protein
MADCKNRYIALSYTWGEDTPTTPKQKIIVNNQPAYITSNLHAALKHILLSSPPRHPRAT